MLDYVILLVGQDAETIYKEFSVNTINSLSTL